MLKMLKIITLLFTLSLILTVTFPVVEARIDTLARRHPPALNRMIKKRQGRLEHLSPPANLAASPSASSTTNTDAASSPDSSISSLIHTTASNPSSETTVSVATLTPSASQSTLTPTPLISISILPVPLIGSNSTSTLPTTTSSSIPVTRTTSSVSLSSQSTSSPSQPGTTAPSLQGPPSSIGPITITSSATASAATASATPSGTVTKLQRNTIIILIAIGASIGGMGILWTIIRKWKFSPSRSSDDRLQPIDWQPTPHDEHDITEKLGRNGSTRSHGSFTSGNNNHDNLAPDPPAHDFTPGPAYLAPGSGYTDLQRGPTPQPHGGQNFQPQSNYQQPDMPNPYAQGQYYNGAGVGAANTGVGMYPGYDYNRGY